MSRFKAFAIASCLGLLAVAFVPARADQWNKKTILTVNEAVALPNTTLQPGKYVMRLMDSQSNRHIVQVFNEAEDQLITTVLAIPNYRLTPADDSSFGFWETSAGQPRALRSWFYPGDNFGQEFAYPKDQAMQIAKATNQNVPAIMSGEGNSAEVKTMTPSGQTEDVSASSENNTSADTNASQQAATSEQSSVRTGTGGQNTSETASAEQPAAPQPAEQPAEPPATQAQSTETTAVQPQADQSSDASSAATEQSAVSAETQQPAATSTDATTSAGAQHEELPRTASPLPLVGLAGLAAAAAAIAARLIAKRG